MQLSITSIYSRIVMYQINANNCAILFSGVSFSYSFFTLNNDLLSIKILIVNFVNIQLHFTIEIEVFDKIWTMLM